MGLRTSYVTYVDDKSDDLRSILNIIKETFFGIRLFSFNIFSHLPKSILDISLLFCCFCSSNVDNCNITFSVLMIVFSFVKFYMLGAQREIKARDFSLFSLNSARIVHNNK